MAKEMSWLQQGREGRQAASWVAWRTPRASRQYKQTKPNTHTRTHKHKHTHSHRVFNSTPGMALFMTSAVSRGCCRLALTLFLLLLLPFLFWPAVLLIPPLPARLYKHPSEQYEVLQYVSPSGRDRKEAAISMDCAQGVCVCVCRRCHWSGRCSKLPNPNWVPKLKLPACLPACLPLRFLQSFQLLFWVKKMYMYFVVFCFCGVEK